jgi:protein tyrosine/serine phosphatase
MTDEIENVYRNVNVPHVISVIEENKAYRSPRLTGKEFSEAIQRLGIKTIINLQGERPEESWYVEEKKATESAGIALVNIRMKPSRLPHRKDLLKLLDTFAANAHCQILPQSSGYPCQTLFYPGGLAG